MSNRLTTELGIYQKQLLTIIESIPEADCYTQFHPDLSPLAWHLGHCAYIETYWIHDEVLRQPVRTNKDKQLYFPELSPKTERASRVPEIHELMEQTASQFEENRETLTHLVESNSEHALLADHYLLHFLIQHHCQHLETMEQVLLQRALRETWNANDPPALIPDTPSNELLAVEAGNYSIGCSDSAIAYDNERPVWSTTLSSYGIAQRPTTNGEYLGFIKANGYHNPSWWSEDGWSWLQSCAVEMPDHWRQTENGNYYAITIAGPAKLDENDIVYGVSYYEAEAYCRYAGGRLPHELEHEVAAAGYALETGQAWEWCRNHFFPYPDYRAYPYDNYSKPWFDNHHYTLRGGSRFTRDPIRRRTFRNFYSPEKRHVFAGIRVAFDTA